MRILGLAVIVGVLLAATAQAQQDNRRLTDAQRRQIFEIGDKNNDNSLTYQELLQIRPNLTQQTFNRLDTNNDGLLNDADRGPRRQNADDDPRVQAARKLLEADANKDGQVTFQEVSESKQGYPKSSFDRADTNGDGVITAADATVRRISRDRQQAEQQRAGRGQAYQRLMSFDANKDGNVSLSEIQQKNPNFRPEMFYRLDQNRDGVLNTEDGRARSRQRPRNP